VTHEPAVAGLLLAAGGGSRLGQPKALVSVGGSLLVERGIRLLATAGCRPVVVVLGAAADEVRSRADLAGATVVANPDWRTGMGSSLRAGLAALEATPAADCGATVIALVDQPVVAPAAVRRLIEAWRSGAAVAVASYHDEQRNPVLLDRAVWGQVAGAAVGDRGARTFLRARPALVTAVACDDVASPADIDTPADLTAVTDLLESSHRYESTTEEPAVRRPRP